MASKLLAAALCAAAIGVAQPATAKRTTPQYTSITVFGDSLVDAGNIYSLTGGLQPAMSGGYFQGRFTNGYDYTDLLSIALFGTPTTASRNGGTNFAYGGARATATTAVPDAMEQYALYRLSGQAVDRNGLYVLTFGGNDIFSIQRGTFPSSYADADAFLVDAVSEYAKLVQSLDALGVRNILLTDFPVSSPYSITGDVLLRQKLASLSLNPDTSVFLYNTLDFFGRVTTNPGAFGLDPFTQAGTCQSGGTAVIDGGCVGYFSFDGTHPVASVQRALFDDMNRQFNLTGVPEPATWMMMVVGLGMVGAALRRRPRRVTVRYA